MTTVFSRFISIIFHPLLMVTYALLFLLAINPYEFGARSLADKSAKVLLLGVFFSTFLLPAVGVALMKPLGFIKSFDMEDKQERIMPYILTGIFYLWVFKNLFSVGVNSQLFAQVVLGATIGLFMTFFFNIFTKVSAHAAGMGGMVGAVFAIMQVWGSGSMSIPAFGGEFALSLNFILVLCIFLAGLVGTARLNLKAHSLEQIYFGYAIGLAAQLIASLAF